jgi:hypothetical protein
MNDVDWLRDWCSEHVNPTVYDDEHEAENLARQAEQDAKQDGASIKKALEEYGYISLKGYMLDTLNSRVDDEVKRLADKDD